MKTAILIVEDEGLIALDLQHKLEQLGYSIPAIADNADDALKAVERLRPALVLMDIHLKGPHDGIYVADQIRTRFQVPVMFVTAHADRETLERARITEPFGYIVKPFHGVDFRAQIEIALWKHTMEKKLRASESWLSATFRNVADALIVTGSEGNVALMNAPAEGLTGWTMAEARGKPFSEIFQAFDAATEAPVANPLETIGDTDVSPRTLKLRKRGEAAGRMTFIEAQLSPNRDGASLLGTVVVFRDIGERLRAEEQNRRIQKTNALTLMAIGLGRQLAESQRGMDTSIKELVSISQGHAVSLLADIYERSSWQQSLVEQLIRLGRTDPGKASAVCLNDVLTALKARIKKILGFGMTLNLTLEPELPSVRADLHELQESLIRLVIDARGAMPEGGSLDIATAALRSSSDARRTVQLSIRDSGKGLRPGAKDRIFDPYYQARPGNRNPGFSLALVYQFVALSGGAIEVESAPGEGTAYLLSFPAIDSPQLLISPGDRVAASA